MIPASVERRAKLSPSQRRRIRSLGLIFFLAPAFGAWVAQPQSPSQPTNTTRLRKTMVLVPPKEMPVPFHVGEILNYRVSWSAFSNAGSVQLSAPERRNLYGWNTWHFQAVAHTQSPVRSLFTVDDQFDSYSDTATLESRQYETHLNEMGRVEDQVLHFAPGGQASHAPAPIVVVRPGTRDPLGFLYALRAADWRTPEFHAPVYDGRDLYDVIAKRESSGENIKVAAGSYSTSRVGIHISRYGKDVPIHFTVWLADDEARTPVMLQAEVPFGNIRAELLSAK
jgi:Protein of unknown function (DUF3108)